MDVNNFPSITFDSVKSQIKHVNENAGPRLACEIGVLTSLTIIFVISRLIARKVQGIKSRGTDYCIITSLVLVVAMSGIIIAGTTMGFGRHLIAVGLRDCRRLAHLLYFVEVLFSPANAFTKISIVLLYRDIFGTHSKYFKKALWALGILWALLGFTATATLVFQCWPISRAWSTDHFTQCIDIQAAIAFMTYFSVFLNFCTLILPLPLIWNMKLNMNAKLGILALFVLGSGDVGISIARAWETQFINEGFSDFTYTQCRSALFGMLELTVGIMCACFPTLRPLWVFLRGLVCKPVPKSAPKSINIPGQPGGFVRTIGGGFNGKNVFKGPREQYDLETGYKGTQNTITTFTSIGGDTMIASPNDEVGRYSVVSGNTIIAVDRYSLYSPNPVTPYNIP